MHQKVLCYEDAEDANEIACWLNGLIGRKTDDITINGIINFQILETDRVYEERHNPDEPRFSCVALVEIMPDWVSNLPF